MSTLLHHERRYSHSGVVAHAVHASRLDESQGHCWAKAACGVEPTWPMPWLGTGSQRERERAASLPLCKKCDRAVPSS